MPECSSDHRYDQSFQQLPWDQGGAGRHRCAGCAYERGLRDGFARKEAIELDLGTLPLSQAGVVRHRSAHAAWALGYLDGVTQFYAQTTGA